MKFFTALTGKEAIFLFHLVLLFLSPALSANPELEPNDDFFQANLLAEGESAEGRLNDADDVDWYKITVPDNSAIQLDIGLTSAKSQAFPNYLSAWKIFIYTPAGDLLEETVVDLEQDESLNILAVEGGSYLVVIDNEGFASDAEYSLSYNSESLDEPAYSDFSGIWDTGLGYYISAHQTADQLIFAILYSGPNQWDVQQGTVTGNNVQTFTLYGAVNMIFDVTMTTPNTLSATQLYCEPAEDCQFSNGHKFTATRIIK